MGPNSAVFREATFGTRSTMSERGHQFQIMQVAHATRVFAESRFLAAKLERGEVLELVRHNEVGCAVEVIGRRIA